MAHTQVLLTEAVPNLGAEADIVRVRRGYALNFLIPSGKALEVNAATLRKVNHLKARRAEREARELTAAEELASRLGKLKLSFELETGESGKAFGSVTAKDIHDRLLREVAGLELPKHAVELDKPIKETGLKTVPVRVHRDVTAKLQIKITAPSAAEPEEVAEEEAPARKKSPRKKKTAKDS
ncbi:MAG: 50S ribosomal protein L9 [Terrimicrobiaceae bacterium]|nr:50S ribosomal protein L9 [Terrimicrobiaceae bacterium]